MKSKEIFDENARSVTSDGKPPAFLLVTLVAIAISRTPKEPLRERIDRGILLEENEVDLCLDPCSMGILLEEFEGNLSLACSNKETCM